MGLDLIRAGANVNAKTGMGSTALHAAALHEQTKLGAVLTLAGASITAENALRLTPALQARKLDCTIFLSMLLSYGE